MAWKFLTNHAHVLLCVAENPNLRVLDLAKHVGITQRAVQRVLTDLEQGGYLVRERIGRRSVYSIRTNGRLRHPLQQRKRIGDLLKLARM